MPAEDRMEWLAEELETCLAFLGRVPRARPPNGDAACAQAYAAGLYDMAEFFLEKVQNDISWQGFREMLKGTGIEDQIPVDSSKLTLKDKG